MVWTYASLGIVGYVAGWAFLFCFRNDRKRTVDAVVLEAVQVDTNTQTLGTNGEKCELDVE